MATSCFAFANNKKEKGKTHFYVLVLYSLVKFTSQIPRGISNFTKIVLKWKSTNLVFLESRVKKLSTQIKEKLLQIYFLTHLLSGHQECR